MAKTARPRASSFFDASAMRRLTVFFGGSSLDLKGREETQTPPPPVPPVMANQRNDNAYLAPTNGISNHGEFTANAPGLSLSVPSPNAMVIPPRAQSLTPPLDGTIPRPPGAGSLSSSYLRPQSPHTSSSVASARASTRNFSGTSALSAASHTSYASSRPDSPLSRVPVPPSPMVAEMPKQFRRQQPRNGGIFGRKRKDDVEIPAAWRLTHASSESLEGYNFGPLVQGDLVSLTHLNCRVVVLTYLFYFGRCRICGNRMVIPWSTWRPRAPRALNSLHQVSGYLHHLCCSLL